MAFYEGISISIEIGIDSKPSLGFVLIEGSWKEVSEAKILVGGEWKIVTEFKIKLNEQWNALID